VGQSQFVRAAPREEAADRWRQEREGFMGVWTPGKALPVQEDYATSKK